MNDDQLYAKIGRMQVEIEDRKAQFASLLQILASVVKGDIAAERVLVNLTDQSCQFCAPGESIGAPATINGLPECVIAPPVEEQAGFYDDIGPVVLTGRKLVIRRADAEPHPRPELAVALNGADQHEAE